MSFILEFLPEAFAEAECVTGDYEARSVGLGARFRAEMESTCAAIVQHPRLWRLRSGGYRRVNLPGFPYYIAFFLDEERLLIIAVAHSSRRPDYFRNRIP
jgi:plasmid stabilization system protein ParE